MKYLKYFLLVAIVFIIHSHTTRTSALSEDIYPGSKMPELKLTNQLGQTINLNDLKGVKVLVNFWAAYDAESHKENVLLWNALKKENYPVVMLSISFDKEKSIFERTVSLDGIDPNYQFYDSEGTNSEIYKTYELDRGFKNYLIDENGMIIAMNFDFKKLKNYLI